jgi:polyhydroxybutyrate depolymerase
MGTAAGFFDLTGLPAKADAAGFVLVGPEGSGTRQTWNAGNCCGAAVRDQVDDVGFIRSLVQALSAEVCVDPDRVFATGHSNGAMMSHRLACEAADLIAAIAPAAGGLENLDRSTDPPTELFACNPTRPVPVMHLHGMADECVPFTGGTGAGASASQFAPITEVIELRSSANGCSATTTATYDHGDVACNTHDGCQSGADVTLCLVTGGGHIWPGASRYPSQARCGGSQTADIIATDAIWDFFVAHPR